MSSKIMELLCKAVKIKPPQGTPDQKFLVKLASAVEKAPDDVWESLADDPAGIKAQEWVNAYSGREDGDDSPLKMFPDWKSGAKTSEKEKDTMTTKTKTKASAKPANKAGKSTKAADKPAKKAASKPATKATKADKPAKKAVAKKPGAPSSRRLIKEIVAKNFDISVDDLVKKIEAKGIELSRFSVSSFRNDMRDSIKVLIGLGMISESKLKGA